MVATSLQQRIAHIMQNSSTPSIIKPIAIAEVASSAVSLGTIVVMSHAQKSLRPMQEWIARHIVYPLSHKSETAAPADDNPEFQKALAQSGMLMKGGAMLGTGFLSHIPIQLALEGHFDHESIKHVVFGKAAGVATALGSIAVLNQTAPGVIPQVQSSLCPIIDRCMQTDDTKKSDATREACQLLTVEIPSSVISGLMNYYITKRGMPH